MRVTNFQAGGEAAFLKILQPPGALFPPSSSISLFTRYVPPAHKCVCLLHLKKSLLFISPIITAVSLYPLTAKLFKRIAPDFNSFPTMIS